MLRADNVVCGTSTTGTGTLTLAACPAPPGGLDFDKWLKATGFNFVSTNAVLVTYTIVEYASNTFATAVQTEKGVGTLTLGASITAATLARSTVQNTVTSMNGTPAPTFSAPTAITIGTAANTLVFVGAGTLDTLPSFGPYWDSTNLTIGLAPVGFGSATNSTTVTNGTVYYVPFYWGVPMLSKTFTGRIGTSTLTGTSNAYAAIYDTNSSGQPGRLLIDYGALGTAGSALNTSFTNIPSAAHASGFFLSPGLYWGAIFTAFSGGTGSSALAATVNPATGHGIWGLKTGGNAFTYATATATANPAPATAGVSGYFIFDTASGSPGYPVFWLS